MARVRPSVFTNEANVLALERISALARRHMGCRHGGTTDDVRVWCLTHFERWARDDDDVRRRVPDLLENVWPRLRAVQTEAATHAMIELVLAAGPCLPDAAAAAKRHVARLGKTSRPFMPLDEDDAYQRQYASVVRSLLMSALPENFEDWPYGTRETLDALEAAQREEGDQNGG